ncbi:MAG: DUF4381 domain-containing protein [Mesorhizobium sp.]|nr:MAG: DUF4381 domain-containing protein [Mesorhizobium sp.]
MDGTLPDAQAQALKSLADIVLPAPVPWWPQTWGWALLAVVILALAALALWRWLHLRRVNRHRREALALLTRLEQAPVDPGQIAQSVRMVAELLKRVALAAWPRSTVASLTGEAWVKFLRDHGNGTIIPDEAAALLADGEYHPAETLTKPRFQILADTARAWIEGYRVSA